MAKQSVRIQLAPEDGGGEVEVESVERAEALWPNATILYTNVIDERGNVTIEDDRRPRAPEADDVRKLTVAELRALAEERGIDVPGDAKKADLIAAVGGAE